ncbi:MAG: SDR family NAD(P)-dependent oxidoreductase [Solirubrobacteraceae bacterium]
MSELEARRVLVLGGTSELAAAMLTALEPEPAREIVLAGRDEAALERVAARLRAEGRGSARTLLLDAADTAAHGRALADCFRDSGGFDLAILAVGVLGERGGLPGDIDGAVELLSVNTVGAGSLLMHTAALMRERRGGTIVVLSSVAAERARASNAVYCASKAGLDALAQGLHDALAGDGVRVLVVRPGFVHTRMTAGLQAPPLATTPEVVAAETLSGLRRGAHTVWAPARLRWVMAVLRMLPRALFRRLPA